MALRWRLFFISALVAELTWSCGRDEHSRPTPTPGSLKAGFGIDGVEVVSLPGDQWLAGITIDSSGHLVIAGSYLVSATAGSAALLERIDVDTGVLDPTLGVGGVAVLTDGTDLMPQAVTLDRSGRIVLTGDSNGSSWFFARANSSGSLDATFGNGGVIRLLSQPYAVAPSIHVLNSGKILALGSLLQNSGDSPFLLRVTSDGVRDATFGTAGILSIGTGFAEEMLADSVERMDIGVGNTVVRRMPGGATDTTFGNAGTVALPFLSQRLARQDGGMLAAGPFAALSSCLGTAKIGDDGQLDASYGSAGIASFDGYPLPWVDDVAIDSHGRILVSGYFDPALNSTIHVLRLLPDGTPDSSFGSNGVAPIPCEGAHGYLARLGIAADETIIVVGNCGGTPGNGEIVVFALNP